MTGPSFRSRPVVKPIDLDPYLQRLGVYKELPSLGFLKRIHRNHQLVFPFENLDIHFRREIVLDIEKIYHKLVIKRRGGFCYEQNLLFYHLLIHLGYDCHLISARVWNKKRQEYGPEYDHMAILLKLREDLYLCDVGYGADGFIYPKKFSMDELQMDYDRYFAVTKNIDDVYFLKRSDDGVNMENGYRFLPKIREPIEFIDMCRYQQSSPESSFLGRKIMTKLTQTGRIKLTDQKLSILEKGVWLEEEIMNEDAFYAKMEEHFGISYQSLLHG